MMKYNGFDTSIGNRIWYNLRGRIWKRHWNSTSDRTWNRHQDRLHDRLGGVE